MTEERYELTPLGFLGDDIYNRLMLHMYRSGYNGIVLDDGKLSFVEVTLVKDNG